VAGEDIERRLTAILSTDVVGYSRLMGEDEAGTLAALKAHRANLIEPKTAQHNGRTIKLMGDGALMEFPSVVEAVIFAVEVQMLMRQRNAATPAERQIVFRIGINIGDVIIEGDDIYGDGVNVAARLEGLSEPGGICMSGTVVSHVKGKMELNLKDLGEQHVKNIADPVRVYLVVLRPPGVRPAPGGAENLALPDKPSIAVLPFVNLSGDPEQEFFADGMAEEIITALSHHHWFFVIARNSSFTYKGRAVDVTQVAKELGVRYVLEGSVRKSGNRVRVPK
jgi:adenylate cyclase